MPRIFQGSICFKDLKLIPHKTVNPLFISMRLQRKSTTTTKNDVIITLWRWSHHKAWLTLCECQPSFAPKTMNVHEEVTSNLHRKRWREKEREVHTHTHTHTHTLHKSIWDLTKKTNLLVSEWVVPLQIKRLGKVRLSIQTPRLQGGAAIEGQGKHPRPRKGRRRRRRGRGVQCVWCSSSSSSSHGSSWSFLSKRQTLATTTDYILSHHNSRMRTSGSDG
jgi:hypothetical protein